MLNKEFHDSKILDEEFSGSDRMKLKNLELSNSLFNMNPSNSLSDTTKLKNFRVIKFSLQHETIKLSLRDEAVRFSV